MAFAAKMLRILFLYLILFMVANLGNLKTSLGTTTGEMLSASTYAATIFSTEEASDFSETHDVLYSPEELLLSDAVLSPIPSFQFGFISVLACLLFAVFSLNTLKQVNEKPTYLTSSYFHTLFLSAILIHAP